MDDCGYVIVPEDIMPYGTQGVPTLAGSAAAMNICVQVIRGIFPAAGRKKKEVGNTRISYPWGILHGGL